MATKTTTTTTPRTALYARVSTTGHGQDVGLQLDELRQVARQRGWNVVAEHVDDGVSGAATSRPALDRLMDSARRGHLDLVAVWRFDRFARSTQHLLVALDEFRTLGVDFISVREAIDTSTSIGKMVFTLIAAVAEMEKAVLIERVTAGVRRAQSRGTHCGRPRVTLDVRPAAALAREGPKNRDGPHMLTFAEPRAPSTPTTSTGAVATTTGDDTLVALIDATRNMYAKSINEHLRLRPGRPRDAGRSAGWQRDARRGRCVAGEPLRPERGT